MPIDPSILLGARGLQLPDPLETAKQGLSLADLSTASAVRQYALKNAERSDQATQVLGAILPQLQAGNWSEDAVRQAFGNPALQAHPEAAINLLKTIDERRKADLEAQKTRAETAAKATEAKAKAFNDVSSAAFGELKNPNPDAMSLSRVNSIAKFYGLNLPEFTGDQQNPSHISSYLQSVGNAAYAAKDQVTAAETAKQHGIENVLKQAEFEQKKKHEGVQESQSWATINKPTIQATDEGLFSVDPRKPTMAVPITGPTGEPLVKPAKALSETQSVSTGFAMRMRDARATIDQLEEDKSVDPTGQLVAHAGGKGWVGTPANYAVGAMNPQAQVYQQAQRNWVTANLRKESGAAIPPAEMQQELEKWFPVPGDRPEVVASKRASREVAEKAMIINAGPGAKNVPEPVVPTKKDASAAAPQGKFSATTPSGVTVYFDSEAAMNAAKMRWAQISGAPK
jgi:hypothetical protein